MSPPEVWGPPIWTFFHKLAENINENHYNKLKNPLFFFIKRICSLLPCPECSKDATLFLAKIDINKLVKKNEFKKLIYIFHKYVNVKKRKRIYNYSHIDVYKKYNMIQTFNKFISVYNTNGNMNLLTESFQRKLLISDFKKWFLQNIKSFLYCDRIHNPNLNPNPNLKNTINYDSICEKKEPEIIEEHDKEVVEEKVEEHDKEVVEEIIKEETEIVEEIIKEETEIVEEDSQETLETEILLQEESQEIVEEDSQETLETEILLEEESQEIVEEEPQVIKEDNKQQNKKKNNQKFKKKK